MSTDWIKRVRQQGKYAPPPPPIIVASSEGEKGYAHYRRAPTYDLEDYKDGYGEIFVPQLNGKAIPIAKENPVDQSLALTDNFWQNPAGSPKIWTEILAYLLTQRVSLVNGSYYLERIYSTGLSFPSEIQKVLLETGEVWAKSGKRPEQELVLFGEASNRLQLYLPKHLHMNKGLAYFFFSSLYWLRHRASLKDVSDLPRTLQDLYLVTANPFDRHPARKLLSYYNDTELYSQFGRSDEYLFPKIYASKREQLDGIVAFSLAQYGYYSVKSWSRPIRLLWNLPTKSVSSRSDVVSQEVSLEDVMRNPNLPAKRLAIQVESSWPWLKDKEAWLPFLNWANIQTHFTEDLRSMEHVDRVPDGMTSLEDNFNYCMVCHTQRIDRDFALCGHPVCAVCQPLTVDPVKCPFCKEHFVCDSIDDLFINRIRDSPSIKSSIDLRENIQQAILEKNNRKYSFDWASFSVSLERNVVGKI